MQALAAREKRKKIIKSIQNNIDVDLYMDMGEKPKERLERMNGIGYLKAVDRNGHEHFFSFDINKDGVSIGNRPPSEFPMTLEERKAEAEIYKKKIDLDLLYKIKKNNGGVVKNIPHAEDMIDQIESTYEITDEAVKKLRDMIAHEKSTILSYNRATHASMSLNCSKDGFQIGFAANCEAIKMKDEFNWHLQNTSQWLYAGCIQGLVYEGVISHISSHH